jgi:hypothetical protein
MPCKALVVVVRKCRGCVISVTFSGCVLQLRRVGAACDSYLYGMPGHDGAYKSIQIYAIPHMDLCKPHLCMRHSIGNPVAMCICLNYV